MKKADLIRKKLAEGAATRGALVIALDCYDVRPGSIDNTLHELRKKGEVEIAGKDNAGQNKFALSAAGLRRFQASAAAREAWPSAESARTTAGSEPDASLHELHHQILAELRRHNEPISLDQVLGALTPADETAARCLLKGLTKSGVLKLTVESGMAHYMLAPSHRADPAADTPYRVQHDATPLPPAPEKRRADLPTAAPTGLAPAATPSSPPPRTPAPPADPLPPAEHAAAATTPLSDATDAEMDERIRAAAELIHPPLGAALPPIRLSTEMDALADDMTCIVADLIDDKTAQRCVPPDLLARLVHCTAHANRLAGAMRGAQ